MARRLPCPRDRRYGRPRTDQTKRHIRPADRCQGSLGLESIIHIHMIVVNTYRNRSGSSRGGGRLDARCSRRPSAGSPSLPLPCSPHGDLVEIPGPQHPVDPARRGTGAPTIPGTTRRKTSDLLKIQRFNSCGNRCGTRSNLRRETARPTPARSPWAWSSSQHPARRTLNVLPRTRKGAYGRDRFRRLSSVSLALRRDGA